SADDVEKRGLARARRSGQSRKIARFDLEIDAAQGRHFDGALGVDFFDSAAKDDCAHVIFSAGHTWPMASTGSAWDARRAGQSAVATPKSQTSKLDRTTSAISRRG